MNNMHNVEKTIQKFQQLAKDAQSNGDPVLAQNYFQHADHYLRRFNELSEKENFQEKRNESGNSSPEDQIQIKRYLKIQTKFFILNQLILNQFLFFLIRNLSCLTLKILPDGNFNFCEFTFSHLLLLHNVSEDQ